MSKHNFLHLSLFLSCFTLQMMSSLQRKAITGISCALKTTLVFTSIRTVFYGPATVAAKEISHGLHAGVHGPSRQCKLNDHRRLPKLADVCVWKPPSRYCHPSWCHPHHGSIPTTHFCKRCYMSEEELLKDPNCEVDELKRKFDARKVYVIDVRKPHELEESGKIPDALNIPLDIFEEALKLDDLSFRKLYGMEKPSLDGEDVVINCRSGVRSLTALKIARSLGYHRARHLPGGFLLWQERFGDFIARLSG